MSLGILATKVGMTQIYTAEGVRLPVTVLKIEPNTVIQKRSVENDGYTALQVGTGAKSSKRVTKPEAGHYKNAEQEPRRYLREFRVDGDTLGKYEVGQDVSLGLFDGVTSVDVSGTSKGKGFAGVMKRHNMAGFRATHGTHEYFRHGGSIGMRSRPGKVFKGKRMPGHMGNERVTVINLNLVQVLAEENLLLVRGAVPGAKGALLEVRPSLHKARKIPGLSTEAQEASKNPMKASKAGAGAKKKK
ncbi:MAG: 50S ribosomal protein L3 [Myxococcota bacterium]